MANLGQLIPALFVKDGELLTPEQIKRRQALSANALAFATDTSPNAGGVASILAKGLAGFRSGWEENRANAATAAAAKENQSLISGLLGGTGGMSQGATVAEPTVAPMQNAASAGGSTVSSLTSAGIDPVSEVVAAAPSNGPSTAASAAKGADVSFSGKNPYEIASSLIGKGEVPDRSTLMEFFKNGGQNLDPATTAWCAAFVNSSLGAAGMQGTGKLNARSFLDWGTPVDTPQKGDIAVFSRGNNPNGWQGHVGFFDSTNPDGTINVLGGNQGNGVSIAPYSADRLLGYRRPAVGGSAPPVATQPAGINPSVIAALSSPVANENTRAVASLLLNNQFQQQEEQRRAQQQRENFIFQQDYQQQQQANDPLRQLQIQEAQQKLAQGPNAGENFYGNPVAIQNSDGSVAYGQIGNRGTFKPIQLREGQSFAPPTRTIDAGTETILVDQAGNVISRTPKNNRTAAAETAGGTVEGRVAAERQTSASSDIQAGQNALDVLNQIENHPGLSMGTGITSLANRVPGTEGYNFQNIVEQAKSGAFLSAIQQMRGLGALSNNEGAAATSAITRMDTATSKDAFLKALADYRKIVQQGIDRAQKNLKAPDDAATTQQPSVTRRKYNPATGRLE